LSITWRKVRRARPATLEELGARRRGPTANKGIGRRARDCRGRCRSARSRSTTASSGDVRRRSLVKPPLPLRCSVG